jgi:predicted protein tyrosine phosphatase
MKYNIQIMSKQECTLFSTKDLIEDCIIISINDTGYNTAIYDNKHIVDIIRFHFDDIEMPINGLTRLNKRLAKLIKNFVDTYKDKVNNIIVHCTAGISRSGAVGCTLAMYLNGDNEYLLKTGQYIPNKHVYKLMCEVLELDYSEELFKEKLRIRNKGNRDNLKGCDDYGIRLEDMFCDVIVEED